MIYFRTNKIQLENNQDIQQLEQLINERTSKVHTLFDLTSTTGYVLPEERIFAGRKLNNGDIIISRFRHTIYNLVPRVVTKWNFKKDNGELHLTTKNRLSFLSTIGFAFITIIWLGPILRGLFSENKSFDSSIFLTTTLFLVINLLIYREVKKVDTLLKKIIGKEKIKRVFAA